MKAPLLRHLLRHLLASLMIIGMVLANIGAASVAHESTAPAHVIAIHDAFSASSSAPVMNKMVVVDHKHHIPDSPQQHDLLAGCPSDGCAICGVMQVTQTSPPTATVASHIADAVSLTPVATSPPTRPPTFQI